MGPEKECRPRPTRGAAARSEAVRRSAHGLLQGLLLLALLWGTWEAYTWLGDQAGPARACCAAGARSRRQLLLSWASLLAGTPFLVAGALLGGWAQTALFAGACSSTGRAPISPPAAATGGCTAPLTGASGTACSSCWRSASRSSPSPSAPAPARTP
ncbi:hypothetical protein ACFQQB_09450 [Nonomuraea rubra]|uniref:hypothetical protein n=1 Tax=Nonomuraea rubra TaxID=46180 RepID=UPI003619CFCA